MHDLGKRAGVVWLLAEVFLAFVVQAARLQFRFVFVVQAARLQFRFRILLRNEQYMNMVVHHAIRQQMVFMAVMMIQIGPHHRRQARIGKPVDRSSAVEAGIIGREQLFVNVLAMFSDRESFGRLLFEQGSAFLAQFLQDFPGQAAEKAIGHEMSRSGHVPVRQVTTRYDLTLGHQRFPRGAGGSPAQIEICRRAACTTGRRNVQASRLHHGPLARRLLRFFQSFSGFGRQADIANTRQEELPAFRAAGHLAQTQSAGRGGGTARRRCDGLR